MSTIIVSQIFVPHRANNVLPLLIVAAPIVAGAFTYTEPLPVRHFAVPDDISFFGAGTAWRRRSC